MNADTLIPVTINGSTYQVRAADAFSEILSWETRWTSITPAFARDVYGVDEAYAHGFAEYVRHVALTPVSS